MERRNNGEQPIHTSTPGTYAVSVEVLTGSGNVFQNYTLYVTNIAGTPVISSSPGTTVSIGQDYYYNLTLAVGYTDCMVTPSPALDVLTFGTRGTSPFTGGSLHIVAANSGSYQICIDVSNSFGHNFQNFTLTVPALPVDGGGNGTSTTTVHTSDTSATTPITKAATSRSTWIMIALVTISLLIAAAFVAMTHRRK